MKYGVCTNQPSLCARAAARELMAMPSPDTRCPEPGCGKPLLPAPGSESAPRSSPLLILGAIALALAALAVGAYFWQNNNAVSDDSSSNIRASSVPIDNPPAEETVTPASAPASYPPASSSSE